MKDPDSKKWKALEEQPQGLFKPHIHTDAQKLGHCAEYNKGLFELLDFLNICQKLVYNQKAVCVHIPKGSIK